MSKLLSLKATLRMIEEKSRTNNDYRNIQEEIAKKRYHSSEEIAYILQQIYEGEKVIKDQDFSSHAFTLLQEMKMKNLYSLLAGGHNTVFCIDIAGDALNEKRWYEVFTVDFSDTYQSHCKLTREVALALDLPAKELKSSGRFHSRYCLEYKGYAENLVHDLAERLYDDRSCLKSEVL